MSDAKEVRITFEYRGKKGEYCNNRLLIFQGELEKGEDGLWHGFAKPLYEPRQHFEIHGEINLVNGQVDLVIQVPDDPNHKPWEPVPRYLWTVTKGELTAMYVLPNRLVGKVIKTFNKVWMGDLARSEGKVDFQLNEV